MATYTDNYNLTKPTMNELADIRVINNNMDTVDTVMHGAQVSIADAYDPTLTYDVGDLVMNDFLLYKCVTAVTVPEAFDANKWTRTTAAAEGSGGGSGGGGINYSTTEQNTGLKWIDGSDIYQITISDTMPVISTDGVNVDKFLTTTPANIDTLIDYKVKVLSTVGNMFIAPYLTASGYALRAFYNVENSLNQLQISANHTMWSECSCIATLWYTKATTP